MKILKLLVAPQQSQWSKMHLKWNEKSIIQTFACIIQSVGKKEESWFLSSKLKFKMNWRKISGCQKKYTLRLGLGGGFNRNATMNSISCFSINILTRIHNFEKRKNGWKDWTASYCRMNGNQTFVKKRSWRTHFI